MIRSFAVKFEKAAQALAKPVQTSVALPFNQDAISSDNNRADGNMANGLTLPAELVPTEITSEDINFKMGSTTDGAKNVVAAKGQKITLPAGEYNKLYILAAATKDTQGELKVGKQTTQLEVQNWTGFVGQHYGRKLTEDKLKVTEITNAFSKRDNIAWYASHCHSAKANEAYQYSYLYKYEINLPKGAKSVTLPQNENIKIFAITVANNTNEDVTPLQPLYDDFKDNKPVVLR
jgi:alpha-mannosidase